MKSFTLKDAKRLEIEIYNLTKELPEDVTAFFMAANVKTDVVCFVGTGEVIDLCGLALGYAKSLYNDLDYDAQLMLQDEIKKMFF